METFDVNLFLVIVGGILIIAIIIGFGLGAIKQRVTRAEQPVVVQAKIVGKKDEIDTRLV